MIILKYQLLKSSQVKGNLSAKNSNFIGFFDFADVAHFVILRGTAGIGKTTLLEHLFLDELSNNYLIPIYLQLKDINNTSGKR